VSAKDLGTGKEQKITITASGGLAKDEVERMVKEAESHAADDKKRREEIEARNSADSLVYQAEKTIKDLGDKADKALVEKVQQAADKLKETLKGNDIEKIKADTEELTKPLYELTSAVYNQAGPQGPAGPEAGPSAQEAPKDEKVVDADYKVMDDDKKK
jgi:molecular chaperone DnaK